MDKYIHMTTFKLLNVSNKRSGVKQIIMPTGPVLNTLKECVLKSRRDETPLITEHYYVFTLHY
jgi:hypothetical protein